MDSPRQLIAQARQVIDRADAAGRDLTDHEAETVDALLTAAEALARVAPADRLGVPLHTRGRAP